jgi:hypothetical protein
MASMGHLDHRAHMPSAGMHPTYGYGGPGMGSPLAAPTRSNTLVFILIAILIAAIAVLAYLVMTK